MGIQVPKEWTDGLVLPTDLENTTSNWHLGEIMNFFDKFGIVFFEDLQIWHVKDQHQEFIKRVGREPISKTYPFWLVSLNEVKNKIRNFRFK